MGLLLSACIAAYAQAQSSSDDASDIQALVKTLIVYIADLKFLSEELADVEKMDQKVLEQPEPMIHLHTLGDSSVNFIVRPWTTTEDYWDVYWDIMREVKLRFDREGISIPFPQRDVHLYPVKDD
jgi:small conductance mechanosensitive channel